MSQLRGLAAGAAILAGSAGAAHADEVLVGGYAHNVQSFISSRNWEAGNDFEVGYRTAPFNELHLIGRPMLYASYFANDKGRTSFGAVGFQWRRYMLHGRLYGQVGLGGAVHTQQDLLKNPYQPGISPLVEAERIYIVKNYKPLGTRFLFNPNLALGVRITQRLSAEAVWTHISNAGLGPINPGMDDFGARLVFRFGPRVR
jgi:hypothetical protein